MSFFKGFKKGFPGFGRLVALLVNVVLLSIVYLLGVGLTSVVARVKGKKFLDTKEKESYWNDLSIGRKNMKECYRQF
tara:strand:+ start:121 stop:351 length:231 start_codon:yes stop_codon:yes gene_type:complete